MLANRYRVQETATALGYASQHHFSAAFRKHHGYPPRLHRKKMEDGGLKLETPSAAIYGETPSPLRPGSGRDAVPKLEAPDAERGTRDARMMPTAGCPPDEFKYRFDEIRYIIPLPQFGNSWCNLKPEISADEG